MQQIGYAHERITAFSEPESAKPKPKARRKSDPAPSRWSYRFQRLMLTPLFRFALRVGLPLTLTASLGAVYLGDDVRRTRLIETVAEMREGIESRPEFMVNMMSVSGASDEVSAAIHEIVPISFPVSSFDIELPLIKQTITGLNPVRSADLRLQPGGVLEVRIDERQTAALWRTHEGLFRIDGEGVYIGLALSKADYPKLPLLSGDGADAAVPEAIALLKASAPLDARLKGFTRMGARRWDVVLDRGQRIMLPEQGAVTALERVIALDQVQDVLERDLTRVDMRLTHRPTIRMNENAVQELWRINEAVEAVANE
ncbi:MAG: cell division protein FtsQ/DivIB [Pseudomonadota bacterium]